MQSIKNLNVANADSMAVSGKATLPRFAKTRWGPGYWRFGKRRVMCGPKTKGQRRLPLQRGLPTGFGNGKKPHAGADAGRMLGCWGHCVLLNAAYLRSAPSIDRAVWPYQPTLSP
jgi:hypothetical protein